MHTYVNMAIGFFKEAMLKIILEPKEQKGMKKTEELQKEMEHYILPIRELPYKELNTSNTIQEGFQSKAFCI